MENAGYKEQFMDFKCFCIETNIFNSIFHECLKYPHMPCATHLI